MIYVDANFWIYWFDQRLSEHKHVLETMREAIREGIILNVITLVEVAHYLRNLSVQEFRDKLDKIQSLTTLKLINLDIELAKQAFKQLMKYSKAGIGARDGVILATMEATATKRIATHDKGFTKIKGLEVIDPIPKTLS
jgi:predicted nucleic acid-binding protein